MSARELDVGTLPVAPVVELVTGRVGTTVDGGSRRSVAGLLGPGLAKRYHLAVERGTITHDLADTVLCKLGVWPGGVFGDLWWETTVAELDAADEAALDAELEPGTRPPPPPGWTASAG